MTEAAQERIDLQQDFAPDSPTAVPLVIDDSFTDEDEALEDVEQDYPKDRSGTTARTLFTSLEVTMIQCENYLRPPFSIELLMPDCRNSTRSLYDSDIVYLEIHGRRYCGDYYMPNDELRQSRGQMLHFIYVHILNNRLTSVPLRNPKRILDIGTGTGEWAIQMGEEYPDADVIGTDIAWIQPTAVPIERLLRN